MDSHNLESTAHYSDSISSNEDEPNDINSDDEKSEQDHDFTDSLRNWVLESALIPFETRNKFTGYSKTLLSILTVGAFKRAVPITFLKFLAGIIIILV